MRRRFKIALKDMYGNFKPKIFPKNSIEEIKLTTKPFWFERKGLNEYDEDETIIGGAIVGAGGTYQTKVAETINYELYRLNINDFDFIGALTSGENQEPLDTSINNIEVKRWTNTKTPLVTFDAVYADTTLINNIKLTFKVPQFMRVPLSQNSLNQLTLAIKYDCIRQVRMSNGVVVTAENYTKKIRKNIIYSGGVSAFKHDVGWSSLSNYFVFEGNDKSKVGTDGNIQFNENEIERFLQTQVGGVEFDYVNGIINIDLFVIPKIIIKEYENPNATNTRELVMKNIMFSLLGFEFIIKDVERFIAISSNENPTTSLDITNNLFNCEPTITMDGQQDILYEEVANNILFNYANGRGYGSLTTHSNRFKDDGDNIVGSVPTIIEPNDLIIFDIEGYEKIGLVTKSEFNALSGVVNLDFIEYKKDLIITPTKTQFVISITNEQQKSVSLRINKLDDCKLIIDYGDGEIKTTNEVGDKLIPKTYSSAGNYIISMWLESSHQQPTTAFLAYTTNVSSHNNPSLQYPDATIYGWVSQQVNPDNFPDFFSVGTRYLFVGQTNNQFNGLYEITERVKVGSSYESKLTKLSHNSVYVLEGANSNKEYKAIDGYWSEIQHEYVLGSINSNVFGMNALNTKNNIVSEIILNNKVRHIPTLAFKYLSNLKRIIIKNEIPPTLQSIEALPYSVRIYVPTSVVNVYKSATNWSYFADNIYAIE